MLTKSKGEGEERSKVREARTRLANPRKGKASGGISFDSDAWPVSKWIPSEVRENIQSN